MELKDGYKKTDIGIIPKDWELENYGNVFQFQKTATYSRSQIFEAGNVQYLHYGDIHTKFEHFIDFDKVELPYIKNEQLKTYSLIKEGDLIMADASEDYEGIGKSIEVKNLRNKQAISGLHTFLLRSNNELLANGFKGYLHSNKLIKNQFDKLATGLKVYGVSKNNLKTVLVPLPPLPEQQAIAQVLSDTDNLIQALEKQIAKKRLIKQGAMQKLLTPQEGWEEKKLGKIANFYNGKAHEQFIDEHGKYKVVNSKFISTNGNVLKYSNQNLCPLREGDITMVMSDIPNGKALAKCFIIPEDDNYALNQRICALRSESVNNKFLASILNRNKYYLAFDGGTGQTNLKKADVLNCPIKVPPSITEQSRIADILSNMQVDIDILENKLEKYKLLKQGLMQNLLTGKIRLV